MIIQIELKVLIMQKMQEYEYKILIEKQKEGKLNEGETYI